jgi:hypothetical protein
MPLASASPLRSEGIGAGVGGNTSQRSAALIGSAATTRSILSNRGSMNVFRVAVGGEIDALRLTKRSVVDAWAP